MENNVSPVKSALPLGILFGIIMVLELVISYVFKIDPISAPAYGTIINVLNYLVLPAVLIFLASTNYKNKMNNGFISFGTVLKIGVVVCILAALVYSIFNAVFSQLFPEYFEEMLNKAAILIREKNPQLTEEQVEASISMSKKFMNPVFSIPLTILMFAFIGLIYSLIIGAIVKKDAYQN